MISRFREGWKAKLEDQAGSDPGLRLMQRKIRLSALWIILGISLACLDYFTGPFFQFSYLFTIPIGLAAWQSGRFIPIALAFVLPIGQSIYFSRVWENTFDTTTLSMNLVMQISAFVAFSELISLVARQRLFRLQMLESMPVGVWVVDRKGRVLFNNMEGRSIWGGDPKERTVEGPHPRLFKHGTDIEIDSDERPVVRALKLGDSSKNEVLDIETSDGDKRVISSSIAPVRDRRGRIQGAVAVNQDITVSKRLEKEREELNRSLEEARANLKVLSGLLPICASCKRIRDDEGIWEQLEQYIHSHSEADFSHGICPDCMRRLYPDFASGSDSKK